MKKRTLFDFSFQKISTSTSAKETEPEICASCDQRDVPTSDGGEVPVSKVAVLESEESDANDHASDADEVTSSSGSKPPPPKKKKKLSFQEEWKTKFPWVENFADDGVLFRNQKYAVSCEMFWISFFWFGGDPGLLFLKS